MNERCWWSRAAVAVAAIALVSCGGSTPPEAPGAARHVVGGSVSGLASGALVVLQNNGADDLTITTNRAFQFPTAIPEGSGYRVEVLTQPAAQTCSLGRWQGDMGTEDVTDVAVVCAANTYTIGGAVSGLAAGTSVTLQNNGGDNLVVNGNGGFTFPHSVADKARYEVTVFSDPAGRHCEVANGGGDLNGANVTSVLVTCTPLCSAGVCCDTGTGAFRTSSFPCETATAYRCSSTGCGAQAQTRTSTRYCSGAAATCSGAVVDGAWTGVADCTASQLCVAGGSSATCSACAHGCSAGACLQAYAIGGTVSGLAAGSSVTLQNNRGDNLVVNGNGGFTFPHTVLDGARYEVTVFSDPAGRHCEVANGGGDLNGANVTNVVVTCTPLCSAGVCCDAGTGAFRTSSFPCETATAYRCSSTGCGAQAQTRTSTRYCSGAAATCSGAVVDGAWTGVADCTASQLCVAGGSSATCSACAHGCSAGACLQAYAIGGTVSGLAAGTSVTLQNNRGDNLVVNGNGGFTFPHPVLDGARYEVTVSGEPAGRRCTVANGAGDLNGANVTNVVVTCTPLCTSGVCCDTGTGAFRTSSFPCGAATAYRCSSAACGAQAQSRTSTQYCSGAAAICSGAVVDGAWTGVADCAASQLCVAGGSSATCSTCAHGCSAGACLQAYTIGGTVSGLAAGTSVTLQNNRGDNLVVNGNGGFTFAHPVLDGARYEVTVSGEPVGRSCTVANGGGDLNGANVTNVVVTCAPLCTSGVCCDTGTGAFRTSSFPCGAATAYRCSSAACGAQAQSRTSTQYCSGAAAICSGAVVDGGWSRITDCNASQLCVSDGGSATCSTCAHGCNAGAGACWPECNPVVDHCCSAAGTVTNCWYDAASGLEWQRDASTTKHPSLAAAIASCQGVGAGWRVPTFAELRSLVRSCPAMETGGACGITSTCTASTCEAGCRSCTMDGGGGEAGAYMPAGLTGAHRNLNTYYYSTTTIPDRYSTTSGEAIWVLNFRFPLAWWDYARAVQPRDDYVVRCVKGP